MIQQSWKFNELSRLFFIRQISIYLAKLIIEIAKTRSGNQFCQDVFFVSIIANRDIMICSQINKKESACGADLSDID